MAKAPADQFQFIDLKPGISLWFDPGMYILQTRSMSLEARGRLITSVFRAAELRDIDFLNHVATTFGFIQKINQRRPGISRAIRSGVLRFGKCKACGSTEELSVDHIIPYSKGGSNQRSNLQCLCMNCNRRKSNH